MKLEEIIKQVSEELNIPYDVCKKAYFTAWKFIFLKAQELPLSPNLSLKEFKELRPNFNMPSLGKFHITEDEFIRTNEVYNNLNKKKDA